MDFNQDMRDIYCRTLMDLAAQDEHIMIVEADLMKSAGTMPFKQAFPSQAIDVGVAEANLVGISAGLSAMGRIPFASTFGCFASRRAFDQFFISCNYAHLNVNLVGMDPGVTAAFNGGTHMPFEDIGLMNTIPALTISEPCDPVSLKALTEINAKTYGNSYMRLYRKRAKQIYSETQSFAIGRGNVLIDGTDVTIIALGALLVPEALEAAKRLQAEGISAAVIDPVTVKPLDGDLILSYAKRTGCIVTAENHQVAGGLGSIVAGLLAEHLPTAMRMVGIRDEFGQVGTMEWLQKQYRLTADEIVRQVHAVVHEEEIQ